jgi:ABC-type Fe3+ transport system permease subunit
MKKLTYQLKIILLTLVTIFSFTALPAVTFACGDGSGSSKDQVLSGIGESGSACDSSGVSTVISAVVNILSYIVGIVSVVMIIVGGIKFTTSGGDSNAVSSAKNTVLYAFIGLIIAALAQVLVHFVLTSATTGTVSPS